MIPFYKVEISIFSFLFTKSFQPKTSILKNTPLNAGFLQLFSFIIIYTFRFPPLQFTVYDILDIPLFLELLHVKQVKNYY